MGKRKLSTVSEAPSEASTTATATSATDAWAYCVFESQVGFSKPLGLSLRASDCAHVASYWSLVDAVSFKDYNVGLMDLFKTQVNALHEKWPGILQESPLRMADGGFEVLKVVRVNIINLLSVSP